MAHGGVGDVVAERQGLSQQRKLLGMQNFSDGIDLTHDFGHISLDCLTTPVDVCPLGIKLLANSVMQGGSSVILQR